ncbi:MAG: mechanosensitive ion channel family protein [Acidimicrobiia bacterium]
MTGFREGLENAWIGVAVFVPKLVGFLLILVIGYFIAKALGTVFDKILERVGFDRAVERGGVKKALERTKYDASSIVGKLIFYVLFLFVLQLAFGVFGPNPISDLLAGIIAYLPKVVVAIVIIVIASAVAAAVRELADAALGNLSYGKILSNIAGAAVLTVGIFAALSQLEIAPAIVNGLFFALLAIVVGILIVAVGGGGIQPMRDKWGKALTRLEEEMPKAKREMEGAEGRVKDRADEIRQEVRAAAPKEGAQRLQPEPRR